MLKKLFSLEIVRFAFVGVVNTVFGAAVMFILYNCFNASYWFSSACNYIFGSILSFFLNKYFTFKKKEGGAKQAVYFAVNVAVCYFIAYGIAKPVAFMLLSDFSLKLKENLAMAIGMVIFTLLNFIGQKLVVFSKK